jgi:ferrous iron transport protein A
MNLKNAQKGREYTLVDIKIDDGELLSFLSTLGLYRGEKITLIRHHRGGAIVSVKGAKYSIDNELLLSIEAE